MIVNLVSLSGTYMLVQDHYIFLMNCSLYHYVCWKQNQLHVTENQLEWLSDKISFFLRNLIIDSSGLVTLFREFSRTQILLTFYSTILKIILSNLQSLNACSTYSIGSALHIRRWWNVETQVSAKTTLLYQENNSLLKSTIL